MRKWIHQQAPADWTEKKNFNIRRMIRIDENIYSQIRRSCPHLMGLHWTTAWSCPSASFYLFESQVQVSERVEREAMCFNSKCARPSRVRFTSTRFSLGSQCVTTHRLFHNNNCAPKPINWRVIPRTARITHELYLRNWQKLPIINVDALTSPLSKELCFSF